jgi:hypothetical protein
MYSLTRQKVEEVANMASHRIKTHIHQWILLKTFEVARSVWIARQSGTATNTQNRGLATVLSSVEDDEAFEIVDREDNTTPTPLSNKLAWLDIARETNMTQATRKRRALSPLMRGVQKKRSMGWQEHRNVIVISSGEEDDSD